jgi:4-methylaminobutanoate oxidase (formaldehyde-forming)
VVYTQWLNQRGGIEADLTVTRLGETKYLVVTGAAVGPHDLAWLKRNIKDGEAVTVTDMTSGLAVLGVMGPDSRALLSRLTDADLSNEAFPFGTAQEIDIGFAQARALRITYVGELGWELYVPSECARGLFDSLVAEGEAFDLKLAGMHAMDSLRMEKAYRHWGHDIADEDTAGSTRPRTSSAGTCSCARSSRASPSAWSSSPWRTRSLCSITTSRSTGTAGSWATSPRAATAITWAGPWASAM